MWWAMAKYVMGACIILLLILGSTYIAHLILPEAWRWLTPDELSKVGSTIGETFSLGGCYMVLCLFAKIADEYTSSS